MGSSVVRALDMSVSDAPMRSCCLHWLLVRACSCLRPAFKFFVRAAISFFDAGQAIVSMAS